MLSWLGQVVSDYVEAEGETRRKYRLMDTHFPKIPYGCEVYPGGPYDFSADCSKQGLRNPNSRRRTGEDALIDWLHRLVVEGCDPIEVPPGGGLLDVALERYE
jgi:hypothetical protein